MSEPTVNGSTDATRDEARLSGTSLFASFAAAAAESTGAINLADRPPLELLRFPRKQMARNASSLRRGDSVWGLRDFCRTGKRCSKRIREHLRRRFAAFEGSGTACVLCAPVAAR